MDANGDAATDISDAVVTLQFLFTGLAVIPGLFPQCETASTPDCAYPVFPCGNNEIRVPAVSYTHLTLPTICSV